MQNNEETAKNTAISEDSSIAAVKEADTAPQPPLLNRAQRRTLGRYIRHKAAVQARHIRTKKIYYASWARQEDRCPRCGLWTLGPTPHHCQCQTQQRRLCRMCGVDFMASQREWKQTNVCLACAAQIAYQRENEKASADEAQERWYAMRDRDNMAS